MNIEKKEGLNRIKIVHNKNLFRIIILLFVLLLIVLGLFFKFSKLESQKLNLLENSSITNNSQLANPASVYCLAQNGTLEIRSNSDGSQYGICILNKTFECDEWKFYRHECNVSSDEILSCSNDQDCVPQQCCHAVSCMNKNFKKPCNLLCSQECKVATLDCGQGSCKCINHGCEAILV